MSVEPSYLDTTLVIVRTSRNIFDIIKVSSDTAEKKVIPLVLTSGFVFYAVPSNFIKDLTFFVVGYHNKFNICQHYNGKVDTLFRCDKMIDQLEMINKSTILFSYDNKLVIFSLTGKPLALFDGGKEKIYGFASDYKGGVFVSVGKRILKIDSEKQQSYIPIDSLQGKLRYYNDVLYVLDAENRKLVVVNIPSSLQYPENIIYKEILTNASIINMVQEKFTDEQIIKIINGSKVDFDMGVDAMIALSKQNVSSDVIIAMDNRSKKMIH
jgi:hypothetical protein